MDKRKAFSLLPIGSLSLGKVADVTVLKLVAYNRPRNIADSSGISRSVKYAFVPIAVCRAGQTFPIAPRDQDPIII